MKVFGPPIAFDIGIQYGRIDRPMRLSLSICPFVWAWEFRSDARHFFFAIGPIRIQGHDFGHPDYKVHEAK